MNRKNISRALRSVRSSAIAASAVLALLFAASGAKAGGCPANYPAGYKASAAPAIPFVSPSAVNQPGNEDYGGPASIVGLWHVIYPATYSTSGPLPVPVIPPGPPSSFQFAESLKTWHGDGTEWENAFMPPAGGNFCYGVWEESGHNTVKLHHLGLVFAADGSLAFIFTNDEKNTVASNGETYGGTFVFKLWPPVFSEIDTGKPLQEIKGTTAATR